MTSGWRKRGAGKVKSMNTAQTQQKALEMALAEFENQREGLEEVGITDHSLNALIGTIKEALMSFQDGAQPEQEYKRGYADAMNWKVQNHLEHFPTAQPKPLTDEQAEQILLDMAAHVEKFANESATDVQMSGECLRYILERVAAHGIKGE